MTTPEHTDSGDTLTIDEDRERSRLLELLDRIGIHATVVAYPAHTSIEEGKHLRGEMTGTFTKNLLLKDKKGTLFFLTAHEDTAIDLKALGARIGARGRLGFASAQVMVDLLHVTPGTATPLGLFHDTDQRITLVIDETLQDAAQLNFHPMTHTESIGLTWTELTTYAAYTDHIPIITRLTTETNS